MFSDASLDYFPKNSISNFVNHLHSPIILEDGLFEVALVKYSYVYSSPCIPKGQLLISVWSLDENKTEFYARKSLYSTQEIALHIESLLPGIFLKESKSKMWTLEVDFSSYSRVELEQQSAAKLGLSDYSFEVIDSTGYLRANLLPFFNNGQTRMQIYTDLIKPQCVGDISAPLFLIENYEGVNGLPTTKSVDNPQYFDLGSSMIDNIRIYIKSETGEDLPFTFGNFCAQLHFRRKRY
jgi:hypothetical protein